LKNAALKRELIWTALHRSVNLQKDCGHENDL
jgi:hypothetical protein